MDRPVVLCGLGRIGSHVLDYLHTAGLPVVVVDTLCKPDDPRLRGARLVVGDCRRREVLEAAGVRDARGVLVLTADDLLNVSTALLVRSLNKDARIVLRMFNQNLLSRLGKAVHNVFALSTSLLAAPLLAMTALTGQALGSFRLDDSAAGLRQLAEVVVGPASALCGRSVAGAAGRLVQVLAHLPAGGGERFLLDIDPDARLAPGDRLVLCGEPRALEPLLSDARVDRARFRGAAALLRVARAAGRTVWETDRAVLACTVVLLLVVTLSTVVLHLGVTRYTIPDALLRSVSIMATGGSMHEEEYERLPGIRVFASVLRIFGAVLIAAFTAIVTNYLIRARLGGVLEVRRIPEAGHVVVCGLSTVGFRAVEELVRLGQRVVAIERDPANRFVVTARRLGAAVAVGDAAVSEVLRQANAGAARAVVPATNNDMTNLEVALLVRELNPAQRVVLLLTDPQFATMLREAADVRLAVSVPALAAPAFVAGLFGDRVASVFMLRERLFAVLDMVLTEQDPFAGLVVRAVAVDYHLFPLALLRGADPPPHPLLAARLAPGDRLVAVLALTHLDRVLRRQPSSAAFAVDVTACPLPTRGWLASLLRTHAGLGQREAEAALDHLPLRLADSLTRGQAEDLLAQLARERVAAHLCEYCELPPTPPAGPEGPPPGRARSAVNL
jgi:Trk K+ transport system NAD-binding subunit